MTKTDSTRRALAREARDAFPPMGVYAIRELATGRVRVGASRNVPGTINRIGFELRQGTCRDKDLQAAWHRDGPEGFTMEVLALLKERGEPGFDYAAELTELETLYRDELGANE